MFLANTYNVLHTGFQNPEAEDNGTVLLIDGQHCQEPPQVVEDGSGRGGDTTEV